MILRCGFVATYFYVWFFWFVAWSSHFFIIIFSWKKGRGAPDFELDFSYLKRAVRQDKLGSRLAPSDRPSLPPLVLNPPKCCVDRSRNLRESSTPNQCSSRILIIRVVQKVLYLVNRSSSRVESTRWTRAHSTWRGSPTTEQERRRSSTRAGPAMRERCSVPPANRPLF